MKLRSVFILGSSFLVAGSAFADDTNVTTDATSAKLGVEYKAELNYDDHGFDKLPGYTPEKTSEIDVSKTRVVLSGKINPNTDYKFKFNLLDPTTTPLYYGYGTYHASILGVSIGKMKVAQGGWDNKLNEYSDHVQGYYKKHFAFDAYSPMIAVSADVAGQVAVQLVNDVTTDTTGQWNKTEHPTIVVGWFGELGVFDPLIAYGSYDNNKSNWIDVGGKVEASGLKATLDIKLDTMSNKVAKNNKSESKEDKATSVTLKASYEIKGAATPWVYYSSYDNKQYEDSAANKKDSKVNASTTTNGKFTYSIDDNATVIGVGADFDGVMGKNWVPYLAVISTSAKFADAKDATKEETKTHNEIKIGCYGKI